MINWKKRSVSRVRLLKLFDLVDELVEDDRTRKCLKNRMVEILYIPLRTDVTQEMSKVKICG